MPVRSIAPYCGRHTRDGQRTAIVRAAPGGSAPTVMVLHGAGGSPAGTMWRSGFVEAAARHGFAAVFPQGLNRQWNVLGPGTNQISASETIMAAFAGLEKRAQ